MAPMFTRASSPGRPVCPRITLGSRQSDPTIEGFTRYECLKRAESNVDGLRIALDTV